MGNLLFLSLVLKTLWDLMALSTSTYSLVLGITLLIDNWIGTENAQLFLQWCGETHDLNVQ